MFSSEVFLFFVKIIFLISLSYSYENHTSTEFEASSIYCHKEVYGNESSWLFIYKVIMVSTV